MHDIHWGNLQPYGGDNKKSFEELCFQIVLEVFKHDIANGAIVTSIDDSGGGDGVEFYITYENGDIYGWQAKFFCRLNEGGRKEQIKKSLQTAYKKHPNLKKWFLCSQCNFTPDENEWFDNSLENSIKDTERVLPENHNVELIHWGESQLLNYLKDYPSIHKFFFTTKILTQNWFEDRYKIDIQKTQIKAKYESEIHIPTNIDKTIYRILGGSRLAEVLDQEMELNQVKIYEKEYKDACSKVFSENIQDEYIDIQAEFRKFLQDKDNIIEIGIYKFLKIRETILAQDEQNLKNQIKNVEEYIISLKTFFQEYDKLTESDLCIPLKHLRQDEGKNADSEVLKKELEEIKKENRKRDKAKSILFAPLYALSEYAISSLESCLSVFELLEQNELHISGKAGMGKTHVSIKIYEDQITQQKKPAIFVLAKDMHSDENLENQLKNNFGIPADWSFNDFLGALEITARVNKTKIPIIIDGLNESIYWASIWKYGLESLTIKLKQYPHLVLITTYRTSYEDQFFPNKYFEYENRWRLKETIYGFEDLTWDAIETYFTYYKIKLLNRSSAIGYFKHPLHLKIFCETKNANRQNEVEVSFQNEDLFEVFDEYIKNSNLNVTSILNKLDSKYDNDFTENKLLQLSKYIWENNSRGMPRSEELFRNEELRVFEGENLLIYRDWNREDNKEEIQFTYDLLGSYLVSRYLVKTYKEYYPLIKYNSDHWFVNTIKTGFEFFIPESGTKLLENCLTACNKKIGTKKPLFKFVKSTEFTQKLLNKDTEHPLFDDILRTICILLIKTNDIFLFNVLQNERAKKYSTESLFEINKKYIEKNEKPIKVFLETEFLNQKIYLLDLAENIELDVKHPLNFNFWSDLLKNLSISERDLSWSEYVRRNHSWYGNSHFSNIVRHFEKVCKDEKILSDRVHVAAKKVMWILTTNIRKLRDESTRALYYYARKYPKEFLDLLKYSIDINDPYVPERMLAVSYGLAMARQNDFKDKSYQQDYLLQYGKWLFDNLFSNEAKYTTTHILARDYAKRTIDIALLHQPDLLTIADKELIKYPLVNYPHTKWKEEKDKNEGEYYDGNAPVQMDFRNYTIGRLINDRKNYDDEHNEYKQVLSQIYWRVYNLGYSLEKFGKIDRQIEKDAWNNSYHDSAGKIDRYGKKYSWIAFYEMAGYRSDLGLLKGWNDKDEFRISDVDIDPSFPIELRQYNLFEDMNNKNFLGNETSAPEEWYEVDDDLVIEEYIAVNNQFGYEEKYDWILLKGNMSQKNKADQTRDAHISINAVLVNEDDYKNVDCIVSQYKDYTFDYLRNDEQHYLYEGEIPWCDLMLEGSSENFVIHYNFHDVKKVKKELKVLNNGKALLEHEVADLKKKEKEYSDELWEKVYQGDWKISVPFIFNKKNDDLTKEIAERIGYSVEYIDVPYYEKAYESLQVNIETTVFENLWESSHSEIISNGETKVPSKNICI